MGSSYITGLLVEQRLSELRDEAGRERLARAARARGRRHRTEHRSARPGRTVLSRLGLVLHGVGRSAGQV